jgi:hypothetical protein
VIGTSLSGGPLGDVAIDWSDLTEFAIPDKKRAVALVWPGGALSVDSIAKSAYGELVDAIGAHAS